jgi:hypothetical protein
MDGTDTRPAGPRPALDDLSDRVRRECETLVGWCRACPDRFAAFEDELWIRLMVLGVWLVRLFLSARGDRLDLTAYLAEGTHRLGDPRSERQLHTRFGLLSYARAYLIRRAGGPGYHPLDAELGLTRDGFSPWVIQFTCRLATRLSFAASRVVCRAAVGWSPSTEVIEQWVLGLGRQAEPFARQQAAPPEDGEVLVIEVDGKCPPTATAEELRQRRGRRAAGAGCGCGCQRHRGQAKRERRGAKKRRKKGDHSKNGQEAMVVVLYTLRRGADGRLHGPMNKRVWATFAGRQAIADWARAEATKRGFGPDTGRVVQVVLDGAKGLQQKLEPLFPGAIFTLDVCHVVERLWALANHFHPEASPELAACVGEWKELVYAGRAAVLVERLRRLLARVPPTGPGTKGKRAALAATRKYLEPRLALMRYHQWRAADLVLATGQVEGAVRHVVGERLDCAGMRWIPGRAEAVLHLRCIELNGDWEGFIAWAADQRQRELTAGQAVLIRTDQPLICDWTQAA